MRSSREQAKKDALHSGRPIGIHGAPPGEPWRQRHKITEMLQDKERPTFCMERLIGPRKTDRNCHLIVTINAKVPQKRRTVLGPKSATD